MILKALIFSSVIYKKKFFKFPIYLKVHPKENKKDIIG